MEGKVPKGPHEPRITSRYTEGNRIDSTGKGAKWAKNGGKGEGMSLKKNHRGLGDEPQQVFRRCKKRRKSNQTERIVIKAVVGPLGGGWGNWPERAEHPIRGSKRKMGFGGGDASTIRGRGKTYWPRPEKRGHL